MVAVVWIDRAIAVVLVAAAVWLYRIADDFPDTASIFPHLTLAVIGGLSVILFAKTFRTVFAGRSDIPERREPWRTALRPYCVFFCCILYVASMRFIGFFPATVGLGVLLLFVLEVANRRVYLLTFGVVVLFVYGLFAELLNVPLTQKHFF